MDSRRIYCSYECSNKGRQRGKNFICPVCDKQFYSKAFDYKRVKTKPTCSYKCMGIYKSKQITKSCATCGKSFTNKLSKMSGKRGIVCSQSCYGVMQRGMIRSTNQGKTKLHAQIRHSFNYRQWRSDVFNRDAYTCQFCSKKGGYLEAHHEIPLAELMRTFNIKTKHQAMQESVLWDINNGITYCEPCHKLLHGLTKGKRKITSTKVVWA